MATCACFLAPRHNKMDKLFNREGSTIRGEEAGIISPTGSCDGSVMHQLQDVAEVPGDFELAKGA